MRLSPIGSEMMSGAFNLESSFHSKKQQQSSSDYESFVENPPIMRKSLDISRPQLTYKNRMSHISKHLM